MLGVRAPAVPWAGSGSPGVGSPPSQQPGSEADRALRGTQQTRTTSGVRWGPQAACHAGSDGTRVTGPAGWAGLPGAPHPHSPRVVWSSRAVFQLCARRGAGVGASPLGAPPPYSLFPGGLSPGGAPHLAFSLSRCVPTASPRPSEPGLSCVVGPVAPFRLRGGALAPDCVEGPGITLHLPSLDPVWN